MKTITTLCIVGVVGLLATDAYAKPAQKIVKHKAKVDTRWENRADKNDNGRVSKKEFRDARQNQHEKRQVDTKREAVIDRNDDGYVDRKESTSAKKHYLENRSEVDKRWEKRADKNNDGVVGKKEAARGWRVRRSKR